MRKKELLKIFLVFVLGYLFIFHIANMPDSSGKLELGPAVSTEQKAEVLYYAPDFSLKTLGGDNFVLSGLKGKTTVLVFWAVWCGPCLHELPTLNKLYHSVDKSKVEVVSVATLGFENEKVAELVEKGRLSFRILLDEDDIASSLYQIRSVPTALIIDPKGVVRYRFAGERNWNSSEALEDIRKVSELKYFSGQN